MKKLATLLVGTCILLASLVGAEQQRRGRHDVVILSCYGTHVTRTSTSTGAPRIEPGANCPETLALLLSSEFVPANVSSERFGFIVIYTLIRTHRPGKSQGGVP